MGYYEKSKKRITKPCRICGSKKIVVGWYSKRGDSWLTDVVKGWVYCENCGCRTTSQSGLNADDHAKDLWNKYDTFIEQDDLKKWEKRNKMRRLQEENRRLKKLLAAKQEQPRGSTL